MTFFGICRILVGTQVVSFRELKMLQAVEDVAGRSRISFGYDAAASLDPPCWSTSASAEVEVMSFHLSNHKNAVIFAEFYFPAIRKDANQAISTRPRPKQGTRSRSEAKTSVALASYTAYAPLGLSG